MTVRVTAVHFAHALLVAGRPSAYAKLALQETEFHAKVVILKFCFFYMIAKKACVCLNVSVDFNPPTIQSINIQLINFFVNRIILQSA